MTRLSYILIMLLMFLSQANSQNFWKELISFPGNAVHDIISNNQGELIVSTNQFGVVFSSDDGISWVPKNNGITYFTSYNLAIDFNYNIYRTPLSYKSTDNGNTWINISNGINDILQSRIFAVGPDNSIFTEGLSSNNFTPSGPYKSTNEGNSWITLGAIASNNYRGIKAFGFGIDGSLFVATWGDNPIFDYGVYKSSDGGFNWVEITTFTKKNVNKIVTNNNGKIFIADDTRGIYVSQDNGNSWVQKNNGLSNLSVRDIFITYQNHIYLATGSGVFKSTNDGENWQMVDTSGLTNLNLYNIYVNNGYLYTAPFSGSKLFRSLNRVEEPFVNLIYPNGGDTLFVGENVTISWSKSPQVEMCDVYLSRDGGYTFTLIGSSNSTSFDWTVTPPSSSNCKIKLVGRNLSGTFTVSDISDENFSITYHQQYTLFLSQSGSGSGQIKVNGILRSLPFSQMFNAGTIVSLEAVPDAYSIFTGWSGDLIGSTNPTTITMNSNKDIVVNFSQVQNIPLIPLTVSDTVQKGQDFWIDIQIGTADQPVTNLKVISFTMNYSNTTIIDYVEYQIGPFITGAQATVIPDDPNGNIDASVYRTSGGNSGYGTVIRFKMQISNQATNGQQITISFPAVLANDANGNIIPISPQTKILTVIDGAIVWPGDTDNNGIVNIFDINPIVVNYGITGPQRPNASNQWIGQICPFWNPSSLTYVDCNGNGIINIFDINVIVVNYGLSHSIKRFERYQTLTVTDPPIYITVLRSTDTTLYLQVFIGTQDLPVTDVKVVSFQLSYNNSNYLDYSGYSLGSFMTNPQAQVIQESDSTIAASVFQISGGSSGYGNLINLSFKILPNTPPLTTFVFNFGQVLANRSDGSVQPLNPIGSQITIPVELVSFSAKLENSKVYLSWMTTTETNNLGFELERKKEGDWQKIGFLDGAGTTTEIHNYEFIDDLSKESYSGIIKYRLKQIDFDGNSKYSNEINVKVDLNPVKFVLSQNYPNPFNPSTKINYELPVSSYITLKIFDALGTEIETLVEGNIEAGKYEVVFDANGLSNGVYFYELIANDFRDIKKFVLLK